MDDYVAVFKENDTVRVLGILANDTDEAYEIAEREQSQDEVLLYLMLKMKYARIFKYKGEDKL